MSASAGHPKDLKKLVLGALGVVYGDIGTSPLYAMRECFHGEHSPGINHDNVLGVLSLIVWTLILIVTVKYLVFVMRADNQGEGGILALMALVKPKGDPEPRTRGWWLVVLGLFGAALLYGDGVITPAISVLSAVEGLEVATPAFKPYVMWITIAILIGLFSVQSRGTAAVGAIFGPVMFVWFAVLAALGIGSIVHHPSVLAAMWPGYAVNFFREHGVHGMYVLGSVFLVTTGGEALYADMGHFGRTPIRWAWFLFVLPGLLLNYFGQGALLLGGDHVEHPFFDLAPSFLTIPLAILAMLATVIASQALISGAFSLTRQAVQLGFSPRVPIEHTSADEIGQIYVSQLNWVLLAATIGLVIGFKTSSALAAAYGIAVATTMVITTILMYVLATERWRWPKAAAGSLFGFFILIELAFWGANMTKIAAGGWFPLVLGGGIFTLMATWQQGRRILGARLRDHSLEWSVFQRILREGHATRPGRTAVYLTGDQERVPPALYRNMVHNQVVHHRVVLVTVITEAVPQVPRNERATLMELGDGFWRVTLRFGFMQTPDVPSALERLGSRGLELHPEETTYFVGRETVLPTDQPGMALWREKLFSMMANNAQRATAFYRIPPALVMEIGTQIEI